MPTREQFLVLQANGHIDPNERHSAEQAPTFDYSSNPAYRPGRQMTNWAFQGPFHVPGSAPFLGPPQRQQASRNGQAVASSQRSSNSTQPAHHRTGMQYQLLVPPLPSKPAKPKSTKPKSNQWYSDQARHAENLMNRITVNGQPYLEILAAEVDPIPDIDFRDEDEGGEPMPVDDSWDQDEDPLPA